MIRWLFGYLKKQRALLAESRKHLSSADDNTRKDAVRMLDDEFAFSLGITPEEAGAYICDRLQVPVSK